MFTMCQAGSYGMGVQARETAVSAHTLAGVLQFGHVDAARNSPIRTRCDAGAGDVSAENCPDRPHLRPSTSRRLKCLRDRWPDRRNDLRCTACRLRPQGECRSNLHLEFEALPESGAGSGGAHCGARTAGLGRSRSRGRGRRHRVSVRAELFEASPDDPAHPMLLLPCEQYERKGHNPIEERTLAASLCHDSRKLGRQTGSNRSGMA